VFHCVNSVDTFVSKTFLCAVEIEIWLHPGMCPDEGFIVCIGNMELITG